MFKEDFGEATAVGTVIGLTHVVVEAGALGPRHQTPSLYAFKRGVGGPIWSKSIATGMKYGGERVLFDMEAFLISFEVVVGERRVPFFYFVLGLGYFFPIPFTLEIRFNAVKQSSFYDFYPGVRYS